MNANVVIVHLTFVNEQIELPELHNIKIQINQDGDDEGRTHMLCHRVTDRRNKRTGRAHSYLETMIRTVNKVGIVVQLFVFNERYHLMNDVIH